MPQPSKASLFYFILFYFFELFTLFLFVCLDLKIQKKEGITPDTCLNLLNQKYTYLTRTFYCFIPRMFLYTWLCANSFERGFCSGFSLVLF
jgi:hypothetical protein